MIDTATEMLDWSHMLDVIAAATPRFAAGQSFAYQPLTYGWILGGVIEKAAKQPLSWLMQRYLVQPLELDGAYFGTPASELDRVARLLEKPKTASQAKPQNKKNSQPRKASLSERLLELSGQNPQDFQDAMIPKGMRHFSFYSDEGLQAVIPAANGVFTAGRGNGKVSN